MDDLQFRRIIYADPTNQDDEIIVAQQHDPAKKQFAQDITLLNEKIKQAMKIDVPDDLCNKLILRQTLANHQKQKRKTRIHLALAASFAIIGSLVFNFMQFSSAYTNLGDYALAHVYHEIEQFSNDDTNQVSLAYLNQKMTAFDGNFRESLGKLISADYCRFDGMKSLHLVFQGLTNPVTVFIVPKNEQLAFSKKFNDESLYGESLSFKHANVIIVADKNESLNQWQRSIEDNITWAI